MRPAPFLLLGLAACGFQHGALTNGGGSGSDDAGIDGLVIDGAIDTVSTAACAWSYTPANFDPCTLPAPVPLAVTSTATLDVNTTVLPKKTLTQSDGTPLTVIHLSSLSITAQLTINGTAATILAVDGDVSISAIGSIVSTAGGDNGPQCSTARGGTGGDSTNLTSGGGGGGGGGAAGLGGAASDGGATGHGAAGGTGQMVTSTLSPLRGGCRGGAGGRLNQTGGNAPGGRAGGALQISTNTKLLIDGFIDSAGRGGFSPIAHYGGAGGGAGGGVLLEAPMATFNATAKLCADGGGGGEGGGTTMQGASGGTSPCTGITGALGGDLGQNGGAGGAGGFGNTAAGGAGGAGGDAGGGGGGGAVGWIIVRSPTLLNNNATFTPPALFN